MSAVLALTLCAHSGAVTGHDSGQRPAACRVHPRVPPGGGNLVPGTRGQASGPAGDRRAAPAARYLPRPAPPKAADARKTRERAVHNPGPPGELGLSPGLTLLPCADLVPDRPPPSTLGPGRVDGDPAFQFDYLVATAGGITSGSETALGGRCGIAASRTRCTSSTRQDGDSIQDGEGTKHVFCHNVRVGAGIRISDRDKPAEYTALSRRRCVCSTART